jgi:YgiT-type zinc finger domain-containing protein
MSQGKEKLVERRVTYTVEREGKFYIIENVPARVNEETGEQFFLQLPLISCKRLFSAPPSQTE